MCVIIKNIIMYVSFETLYNWYYRVLRWMGLRIRLRLWFYWDILVEVILRYVSPQFNDIWRYRNRLIAKLRPSLILVKLDDDLLNGNIQTFVFHRQTLKEPKSLKMWTFWACKTSFEKLISRALRFCKNICGVP